MNDIDIVDRLRDLPSCHFLHGSVHNAMKDAAAEISDLRRQLAEAIKRAEAAERETNECRSTFMGITRDLEQRALKAEATITRLSGGDLKKLVMESGVTTAEIEGGLGVKVLAYYLGEQFRKSGAENFLTLDIADQADENDPLWMTVTIQKKGAKSPSETLKEIRADAAVLARECRAARAAISTEPVDWYSLADFQYPKLVSGGLLKKMGEARAATDANGALARGDGEKT